MVSVLMMTPHEMAKHLASKVKAKRLAMNLSQQTLAVRSGVSYGVVKKFERTGKISFESLLKLALVLNALENFYHLFASQNLHETVTLDDLIKEKVRKRGRL